MSNERKPRSNSYTNILSLKRNICSQNDLELMKFMKKKCGQVIINLH